MNDTASDSVEKVADEMKLLTQWHDRLGLVSFHKDYLREFADRLTALQSTGWKTIETLKDFPDVEGEILVITGQSENKYFQSAEFVRKMMDAAISDGEPCLYSHWRVIEPPTPPKESNDG